MPISNKLHASNGVITGSTPVKTVSVASASGAPTIAKAVWGYKSGTGWVQVYPITVSIDSFSSTSTYLSNTLSWSTSNSTSVDLKLYDSSTKTFTTLYTGTGDTYTHSSLSPETSYEYYLYANGPISPLVNGTISSSITAKTSAIPAPTGLTQSSLDHDSVVLSWTAVSGASSYTIINSKTGTDVATGITTASRTLTLTPSTAYSFAVKAVIGSAISPASTSITFTSSAKPGPNAGLYTFKTKSAYTYQSGKTGGQAAGWRPVTDDYYHGNGNAYGSSRGDQTTFFFYYSSATGTNPFAALKDGTCSKMEVYIQRGPSGIGSSAAAVSRWRIHTYNTKPSGTPAFENYIGGGGTYGGSTAPINNDGLSFLEGQWVEIPSSIRTTWFNALVAGTMSGVAWGGSTTAYMSAVRNLSAQTPNGTVRITIA
jgi:hypothetical protein